MCGISHDQSHDEKGRSEKRLKIREPVGLENTRNVCYLNSALQILGATGSLVDQVWPQSTHSCRKCHAKRFCMTRELKQHFDRITSNPKVVHNTKVFQTNLKSFSPSFRLGEQQDAMECYSAFVNKLCDQNPRLKSPIKGRFKSQLTCDAKGHKSSRLEDFTDVALDVNTLQGKCDLSTCLQKFIQPNRISGYKCNQCKKSVSATKTLLIDKAPRILALQLNRADPFRNNIKNNKFVSFPEELDLYDCMTSSGKKATTVYQLYGVIIHKGAYIHSGHYFSFVKIDGIWYKANDTIVTKVDFRTVLKQMGAHVLFYKVMNVKGDRPNKSWDKTMKIMKPGTCSSSENHSVKKHVDEKESSGIAGISCPTEHDLVQDILSQLIDGKRVFDSVNDMPVVENDAVGKTQTIRLNYVDGETFSEDTLAGGGLHESHVTSKYGCCGSSKDSSSNRVNTYTVENREHANTCVPRTVTWGLVKCVSQDEVATQTHHFSCHKFKPESGKPSITSVPVSRKRSSSEINHTGACTSSYVKRQILGY